jgi:hypothetical protein
VHVNAGPSSSGRALVVELGVVVVVVGVVAVVAGGDVVDVGVVGAVVEVEVVDDGVDVDVVVVVDVGAGDASAKVLPRVPAMTAMALAIPNRTRRRRESAAAGAGCLMACRGCLIARRYLRDSVPWPRPPVVAHHDYAEWPQYRGPSWESIVAHDADVGRDVRRRSRSAVPRAVATWELLNLTCPMPVGLPTPASTLDRNV